jgi:hypothetical protein
MQLELYCHGCARPYDAAPDTPVAEVLERLTAQGPWHALGDGETYEDQVFAALTGQGAFCCQHCGEPLTLSEENLGRLTQEMLTCW